MSRIDTSFNQNPPLETTYFKPARRFWITIIVIGVLLLMGVSASVAIIPVFSPSTGAWVADTLRSVIGPGPVAALESLSARVTDFYNRERYQITGSKPDISWEIPAITPNSPPKIAAQKPSTIAKPTQVPSVLPKQRKQSAPIPTQTAPGNLMVPAAPNLTNVLTAPPDLNGGWQAFGPTASGAPLMARAVVNPDPTRPYAQAALVRIDLTKTRLYMVPGTVEPVAAKGVPAFPRPGRIPENVITSGRLLAGFNGGFKAVHGSYGMMVDGVTILTPIPGMATIAIYKSGEVRIGAWGRDITLTPDIVAYRQNCPLLVDAGQINPAVNNGRFKDWGFTVNNVDATWRTGIGITQDGNYLIYAVGNSLTVESLARALQQAGGYYAMQLDINGFFDRFVTYAPATSPYARYPLVAKKLFSTMSATQAQFMDPYNRDFFYVTEVGPN